MAKIYVDHRERNSGIIKELTKDKLDIEEKQLIAGDFIIQTKDVNDKSITVGVERKTLNDFLNSIIDKRIIQQLINLKESFDVPLLILEGSENIYELRNFHPNAIRGMLASIAIDMQIPILYAKNARDTAALITVIAKRLDKEKKPLSLLAKRKPTTLKEQQEILIESLPGIGPSLAKALLKKFKSVKRIMNASIENLQKVEKIGPKKATEIKKIIDENYKHE